MSEPSLTRTFQHFYYAVGRFLFNEDEDMTAAQLVTAKRCVHDGYLLVMTSHRWACLTPTAELEVEDEDEETELPDNFGGLIVPFSFAADAGARGPIKVPVSMIREWRATQDSTAEYPTAFALDVIVATEDTGQRWKALWYPTVSGAKTLTYQYRVDLDVMDEESNIPAGGQSIGPALLDASLMYAEREKGELNGPHKLALFGDGRVDAGSLKRAIDRDTDTRPSLLGLLTAPDDTVGARASTTGVVTIS